MNAKEAAQAEILLGELVEAVPFALVFHVWMEAIGKVRSPVWHVGMVREVHVPVALRWAQRMVRAIVRKKQTERISAIVGA